MALLTCKKYIHCSLLALLCCLQTIRAQYEEKNFTRYSVKDGLSDNGIYCVQQDDQGYIWIGTDAGLNRFDGGSFKKFFQGTAPLNLPSGSAWSLKRFGANQLGIIGKGGFILLNTKNYSKQAYVVPDTTALSNYLNAARDAIELPGKMYAVSTASGFYVYDQSGHVKLRHDAFTINDIGKTRILYARDIFRMMDKKFLVYVHEDRLALYDHEKKSFTELSRSDPEWNIFLHSRNDVAERWRVKYQLSDHEFIFVPVRNDKPDQIVFYDHSLKKEIVSPLPAHVSDSLNWETRIIKLNDSLFAMNSSYNGFYLLKLNTQTHVITCERKKFLPGYKITCLFIDKDKRLWAGTTEGLLKQELQAPVINAYHYPPASGLKFTFGFSCAYRYKNKLYVGRFAYSSGLAIINPDNMQLIKEIDFFSDNSIWNEVRSIEMYHQDTLWIGSNAGLLWFDTKTDRYGKVLDEKKYPWAADFIPVLAPARKDGYAWMCSMLNGQVVRYHVPTRTFTVFTSKTNPALPFDEVKHIVYDSYGDVWVAGHSLARWNNQKQIFDTLIKVYGGVNKFSDDIVTIRADNAGSLWMHNMYNGVLEYKIREKRFIAYSMKDGLPSDVLQAFSPVIDNKLWIAGNNHLTLFDTRTKKITIYDNGDGLPDHRPTSRRIFYDADAGQLYLCSNEYLVKFPFTPIKKPDHSSDLMIEEITVENKKTFYLPSDELNIKYNQNNLLFSYTVIDYEKNNYQFAYKLNDAQDWTLIGNQRSINLTNLPPGDYSVQLRASGKPGVEKIKQFSFVINPPFWKTIWFIGLVALLFAICIYFLYRRRIHHIRQKANIDKQLSQTEMKALQAQMNPHFIFNSLNSIREMILNNENKDASHYLSKFAHLIRITLDQSSQSLVSLRNTIDYLERYMEMESIRNSLFTHEITVDKTLDADETLVPPMLIQPFIENAIWHGISASKRNIHVTIHFKKENEKLVCTIDDNGMGIEQSQKNKPNNMNRHKAVGIINIKNRVKLLNEKYDLQAEINIVDKKDIPGSAEKGTLVTLQLPLEIKES